MVKLKIIMQKWVDDPFKGGCLLKGRGLKVGRGGSNQPSALTYLTSQASRFFIKGTSSSNNVHCVALLLLQLTFYHYF